MELNDQGEYVPVEIQTKQEYRTGGVYMIRQVGGVINHLCLLINIALIIIGAVSSCISESGTSLK